MLDNYYISILNHYKKRFGRKSTAIALVYINFLELSLILAFGSFFMAFAKQMKLNVMSLSKFWILFIVISLFVIFKNWLRYNGKRRNILHASLKSKTKSIILQWLLPFGLLGLSFILFKA